MEDIKEGELGADLGDGFGIFNTMKSNTGDDGDQRRLQLDCADPK